MNTWRLGTLSSFTNSLHTPTKCFVGSNFLYFAFVAFFVLNAGNKHFVFIKIKQINKILTYTNHGKKKIPNATLMPFCNTVFSLGICCKSYSQTIAKIGLPCSNRNFLAILAQILSTVISVLLRET